MMMIIIIIFLNQGKTPGSSKIQKYVKNVWEWTLLWPVIINNTIMQQNRVKSLHRNGDPLEQKRRSSNVPGRLHQSPAQLAQELKSISVDWAMRLHRNRDKITLWWESSILGRQLCCSACLARWSFQVESAVVQDTVTSYTRDLPACHGINVNPLLLLLLFVFLRTLKEEKSLGPQPYQTNAS